MKYVKRMGVNVFIPINSTESLSLLPSQYKKKRLIYPYILITDSSLKANYGFFQYSSLKKQNFASTFRDAKSKIKEAKKNGELANFQPKEIADASSTSNGDLTKLDSPEFDDWTSAKGSTIRAKLINFRESTGSYEFELQNGKTIKVNGAELAPDSAKKASEAVKAQS